MVQNCSPDRKQRVILPGFASELSKILADVSQGSILGPMLFLVFINDIVNEIGSIYIVAYGYSLMTLVKGIILVNYYTGSQKTHIWHTRLRTNCCSRNNDIFSNCISESPFCSCGSGIEDINVYFSRSLFNEQRLSLLNEVNQYLHFS